MDKKQAANILAQATSMLKLTLQEHQAIQKALDVLVKEDVKVVKKK